MATVPQALEKLRAEVENAAERHSTFETAEVEEDYEARINKTLHSLQNQVKQHEAALEELRKGAVCKFSDEPSRDPKTRLEQLRTITAAYKSLTSSEPILPLPNSPLPALLAMRTTLNNVEQTKTSIKETHENITIARTRLRQEDDLKNARELTMSFEKRIGDLRTDNERDSRQTPEERAKAILQEQRQKSRHYLAEMRKLIEALNNFVKEHLAAMVAAEDLGGPVVGDLIDVDSETLKAGFTRQGRPKKPTGESDKSKAERKRRNDEIWGPGDSDVEYGSRGEKEAAGADFRALTEDLLNAAAGDENSTTYIKIRRESAAVRFLVRAKVAQFHPDDARRLRLVDFGQELDD